MLNLVCSTSLQAMVTKYVFCCEVVMTLTKGEISYVIKERI